MVRRQKTLVIAYYGQKKKDSQAKCSGELGTTKPADTQSVTIITEVKFETDYKQWRLKPVANSCVRAAWSREAQYQVCMSPIEMCNRESGRTVEGYPDSENSHYHAFLHFYSHPVVTQPLAKSHLPW